MNFSSQIYKQTFCGQQAHRISLALGFKDNSSLFGAASIKSTRSTYDSLTCNDMYLVLSMCYHLELLDEANMCMQMIHIALWFFKFLGRWKMCVEFEARHHPATKMVQVCNEETWEDMKLICTKTKAPLRHFYNLGKPNSIHALWFHPVAWETGLQGFRQTSFRLGIAPFAAEKFQCETQSFSCNLFEMEKRDPWSTNFAW